MDPIFPEMHNIRMENDGLTVLQQRLLKRMADLKVKPAPLAKSVNLSDSFVRDIIRGKTRAPAADNLDAIARALKTTSDYLLGKTDQAEGDEPTTSWVPLMGEIGAGAEISPEFEQVPEEGIEQIEVPFPLPADMVAFRVKGDSMLPRYDEGDVVVVWREQRRGTDSFYGEEVAVRTRAGQRYLKTLMRAPKGVNLISWNARPIEGVDLVWIGEIYVTVRASQFRRVSRL
jgi:phage repressor protein C with HTH and peptisase S24 domain